MSTETRKLITELKFLSILVLIGVFASLVGSRHREQVKNTEKICQKIGLDYSTKTNWFGVVSRIYIKEN